MLTTAQVWKQEGKEEGIEQGMQQGMQKGEYANARAVILRGLFRLQNPLLLSELTGLSMAEVTALAKAYEKVREAWELNKTNVKALAKLSSLSEKEVQILVKCFENKA